MVQVIYLVRKKLSLQHGTCFSFIGHKHQFFETRYADRQLKSIQPYTFFCFFWGSGLGYYTLIANLWFARSLAYSPYETTKRLHRFPSVLSYQTSLFCEVLNLGCIVFSALMLWKGLMVVSGSESPVVGTLEPPNAEGKARIYGFRPSEKNRREVRKYTYQYTSCHTIWYKYTYIDINKRISIYDIYLSRIL